jgi:hypothetical protein
MWSGTDHEDQRRKTIKNHTEEMMSAFTAHALEKMLDLFNNHDHEVGSQLKKFDPETFKDYTSTDCITYVLNVLTHAFQATGDAAAAVKAKGLGARGTDLAKYLVTSHKWKGIYINPDAKHPRDDEKEHPYSSAIALRDKKYYEIPLEYAVQNYAVTPAADLAPLQLNKNIPPTEHNETDIASLEKVEFGFGMSRGGTHTWLFSKGDIYEVHWNEIGSGLYEASPLREFDWLSGVIVIPPEQAVHLSPTSKLR